MAVLDGRLVAEGLGAAAVGLVYDQASKRFGTWGNMVNLGVPVAAFVGGALMAGQGGVTGQLARGLQYGGSASLGYTLARQFIR